MQGAEEDAGPLPSIPGFFYYSDLLLSSTYLETVFQRVLQGGPGRR